MIIAADWVVPVDGHHVRDGAVLTRGGRIEAVGTARALAAANPAEAIEHFEGCTIIPGLVNAHTHLSLTVLSGMLQPMPMRPFLEHVTAVLLALGDDDFAASAALGALQCLHGGVTAVGDIVYGPEPLAACADAGVGGVFYWEVLGVDAGDLSGELAEREFPAQVGACTTGRARCGLSPHTPYTSGPELLRAMWNVSERHHAGFAIHVAESAAERELMVTGAGPLAPSASRLAHGFSAPHVSSVAYLEHLGVLRDAVAIHCANLSSGDTRLLKRDARGVVLCPRSNEFLGNGRPPVAELSAAGVRLAIGTDSPASNADLDLFAEARAVRALDPSLTSRRVLTMLTTDAAKALGLDDCLGSLKPGLQADLAIVRTGHTEDPETAVLRVGGPDTVRAVMTAGIWRVRDGKSAMPTHAVEHAAVASRAKVERAILRHRGRNGG